MIATTTQLACFARDLQARDLSRNVTNSARCCLLDLIGAAAAGRHTGAARAVRRVAGATFARGAARIWFDPRTLHPSAATWANSAAASALDLDDGHRAAAGHPGAGIVPAVLAAAAEADPGWRELLAAITVGYDVAVRVSAARDFERLDTLSTGRWVAFGVAAAVSRLKRLSVESTAQAMAIAGVLSPGLSAAGYSTLMGNHTKEGIPAAALTGMMAVDLAAHGHTGPLDILDHAGHYDAARITAGLGVDFAVAGVYFKHYACCRWIHGALDALFDLLERHPTPPDRIHSIEVHTFERALRLNNYPDPSSLEGAQYSIPFCLSAGAVRGKESLLPMGEDLLTDPEIVRLARRVTLTVDPELDAAFPKKTPARLVVVTSAGRFEATCADPRGDPDNPLTWDDLVGKFRRLAASGMPAEKAEEVIRCLTRMEEGEPGSLLSALEP